MRIKVMSVLGIFLGLFLLGFSSGYAVTEQAVTYNVTINDFESGTAHVTITIQGASGGDLVLKEIDYSAVNKVIDHITAKSKGTELVIKEGQSTPHIRGTVHRQWIVESNSNRDVEVQYDVHMNTRFTLTNDYRGYIGNGFAQFEAGQMLLYPEGASVGDGLKIGFTVPKGSTVNTAWQKEGDYYYPNRTSFSSSNPRYLPHYRLNDVVLIGQFDAYSQPIGQTNLSVVLPKVWAESDRKRVADSVYKVMDYYKNLFGTSVGSQYMVAISSRPANINIFSGENEASQGINLDLNDIDYSKMGHQIFHRWNGWAYGWHTPEMGAFLREGNNRYYESKMNLMLADELYGLKGKSLMALDRYYNAYKKSGMSKPYDQMKSTSADQAESDHAYNTGALINLMLDIDIIETTGGKKSLDDVYKVLHERYGLQKSTLGEAQFLNVLQEVSGKNYADFIHQYVTGSTSLPLDRLFTDEDGDGLLYYIEILKGANPKQATAWEKVFAKVPSFSKVKEPSILLGRKVSSDLICPKWGISQGASINNYDKYRDSKTIVWVMTDHAENATPTEFSELFKGLIIPGVYNYIQVKQEPQRTLILVNYISQQALLDLLNLMPVIPASTTTLIWKAPNDATEPNIDPSNEVKSQTLEVVKPVVISRLKVPNNLIIKKGESLSIKVECLYTDGKVKLLTTGLTYKALTPNVTVNQKGVVKGLKSGTALILIEDPKTKVKVQVKITVK